jgi:hypothetical protein
MAASEDSPVSASQCATPPLVTVAEDSDGGRKCGSGNPLTEIHAARTLVLSVPDRARADAPDDDDTDIRGYRPAFGNADLGSQYPGRRRSGHNAAGAPANRPEMPFRVVLLRSAPR